MAKELVIVQKTKVSSFPPLMATIETLSRLGVEITLICGNELEENMDFLHKYCKKVIMLNIPDAKSKIEKVLVWSKIRYYVWKTIRKEGLMKHTFYIPTADTLLAMGPRTKRLHYILNLYELFDGTPMYLKNLKEYALKASLITCPDLTRAHIFRVWWKLSKTPTVIPNRPLERPTLDGTLPKNVVDIIEQIKSKKIIHYQGLITPDRDLEPICNAVKELPDFVLILMGKETDYLKQLLSISNNIIYVPFLVPPTHLIVTKMASIGLLSYDHSCLNNIFCAPNKIWEYSSLGVPMLGNDIPGLKNVIEPAKMGLCVDYADVEQIKKCITSINNNYELYANNSYAYFDSVSMSDMFTPIVNEIM